MRSVLSPRKMKLLTSVAFWLWVASANGGFRSVANEVKSVYFNPFHRTSMTEAEATSMWAWIRDDVQEDPKASKFVVPPETGRGVLLPADSDPNYEIFLKGTGANPEHIGDKNKIRYSTDGKPPSFDGKFKVREAYFDIYNAYYLSRIGVETAIPLGVLSFGDDASLGAERGIYARKMLIQTRLSNLHQMSPAEARAEIDRAIAKLVEMGSLRKEATLVEYFFFLLNQMAETAGRMQSAGFQHGTLHHQQFTLAGELVDLGTGTWNHDPAFNSFSKKPSQTYFKFERQPALIQNMLVRTHSVSGERLVPLKPDSETLRLQKGALLGVIQKIDPAAAKRILELDPEHLYWSRFEYVYQHFDREAWTKGTRFAKHFTRTMHLGVPTDTPKTVLGEARPQMAYYGYPRSGIQKLHPKHFESDSRIDAARMKDFTDRNPAMHAKFFPPGTKNGIAKNYWGLFVQADSTTSEFFAESKKAIEAIRARYGSLRTPDAIRTLLYFAADHTSISYGPRVANFDAQMAYQKFTKRRYAEGVALGELIRQKAGECHDSALLSYLVFQQVREVDPEFDVRMVKASTHSGDPHIFSVVSTPNRQVFIIDPIVGWSDRVATYTSALRNELVNQSGMYSEIRYAYEFSHELAACQLMLERPRIIQWLKRFLPGL